MTMFMAGLLAGPLALGLFHIIEKVPFYTKLNEALNGQDDSLLFAFSIFVIGPVEELSKFLMLWLFLYRRDEFNRPIDGLTFAAATGLGFACIENWYSMLELGQTDWARVTTLPFLHMLFASFWGVGLACAKFSRSARGRAIVYVSLPLSFIYHGLFDYIVLSDRVPVLLVLPLVLFLWFWVSIILRRLQLPHPISQVLRIDPPPAP